MKKIFNKLTHLQSLIEMSKQKYSNDFDLIHKTLEMFNVDYCIIGGAALSEYNFIRATEDIDILVSLDSKERFKSIPIGYMQDLSSGRGRRFNIHGMKMKYLEAIYEGEVLNLQAIAFPNPIKIRELKDNVWVINLKSLIETKLQAGLYGRNRELDFYDVRNLILNNMLKKNFLKSSRKDLLLKYEEIWDSLKNPEDDIFLRPS